MDPTTLLGIILGFALIVNGIGFAKIGNFINIPSMVIVWWGSVSNFVQLSIRDIKGYPKAFCSTYKGKPL